MAIGGFVGVDNSARTIKDIFIGVDGIARRVIRAYVGDVNGQAKLWWNGGKSEVTGFIIFENGVFNHVPEGLDIENNIVDAEDYSESVPSGEDITINVLSDFYLTEKTFWIHDDGYDTAWSINNQLIDSNYLDHDNQPIINAIYIPINRIINPQKLKITARGKNLQVLCFYIDGQSTEAANNYIEDSIITVENNELTNYIVDISGYSHIDYIRIGTKKFSEEEPEEDSDAISYEGDLTYFTSPIYAKLLKAEETITIIDDPHHSNYITVTEGQAYIVQILPDSNSTLPDSEKSGYIILAFSNEPFTVRYVNNLSNTNIYTNPRSFLNFVCYGGPLYSSGGYPDDTPLKDNYYKDFDQSLSVITVDDPTTNGRKVVNELGKIIVAKMNNNDIGSGQISMNFDPNKSLQQVSRIEIIGGTENPYKKILIVKNNNIEGITFLYINKNEGMISGDDGKLWDYLILEQQNDVYGIVVRYGDNGSNFGALYSTGPFKVKLPLMDPPYDEKDAHQSIDYDHNFTYYEVGVSGSNKYLTLITPKINIISPAYEDDFHFVTCKLPYYVLTGVKEYIIE